MATFKRDLAKVGIEHRDSTGRVVDFHSLRYTLNTMLLQAGTAPRTAMEIMRHTHMQLTMNVYTAPRILDTAAAVEQLPDLSSPAGTEKAVALRTGTDDVPVNHSKKVLTKSTSGPVFFSRSMAQNDLLAKDNNNSASEILSREKSFHIKQIGQRKKVEGLHQRPLEKMEAAGIEPASRNISAEASTCVVDHLCLTNKRSGQQDHLSASQDVVSLSAVPTATKKYPTS